MSPVCDPNLVLLLGKVYARFFGSTLGADITKLRAVRQMLTSALPPRLPLAPSLDKDEVHYRVPSIVNTNEE